MPMSRRVKQLWSKADTLLAGGRVRFTLQRCRKGRRPMWQLKANNRRWHLSSAINSTLWLRVRYRQLKDVGSP